MAKSIRFNRTGGPEVLQIEDVDLQEPGTGEVLIRHAFVGVNFIDIYHRVGTYPLSLPSGIGVEGVGVVEAVGPGVTSIRPGARVGYVMGMPGAYAEARIFPAASLIALPDGVDLKIAASVLLKGLTAQYLLRQIHPVTPGEAILFHAAAGGTGVLACQWAKSMGARVIGTVGSDAKVDLARAHGCDEVIVLSREDFVSRVRTLTGGKGVAAVFDGVGKDTFNGSLDCLSPRGLMVSFGQSSGKIPPFDITQLSAKGSLMLTRPTLTTFIADASRRQAMADDVFNAIATGVLSPCPPTELPLVDAAVAQEALTNRKTTGPLILAP